MRPRNLLAYLLLMTACSEYQLTCQAQTNLPLPDEQRQTLESSAREFQERLETFDQKQIAHWTDAAIFAKGLAWALRYDREFSAADVSLLIRSVERSRQRIDSLKSGTTPWTTRRGKIALGYQSIVDGSVQPYGLIVPQGYDPKTPIRLDVVLHGSTRPVGMSELRFLSRFDEGDEPNSTAPDQPYIEIHPLGRVENCYRWSGETDVFEAIEDVCRRYQIDRSRIVLRGMSMGASGTWHLGLKHPDRFAALGPYCGYVDTHRFSETPIPGFVKVGPLPQHQELGLHMLDSVDYAANAGVVPVVACMGEKDVFFQAHELMKEAMHREGLTMTNLISPGTGHVIDPVTQAEQLRQIAGYLANAPRRPYDLRFVTWTLKYNKCHWLEVLGLTNHYARAEMSAHLKEDVLVIPEPTNITRFAIIASQLPAKPSRIRIGPTEFTFPKSTEITNDRFVIVKDHKNWRINRDDQSATATWKRPGQQGPIDDAFASRFLCVRGTSKPWNAAAQQHADASLRRFAEEWHHYFRGELPIKNDNDVTDVDLKTRNLILFGDPGSNSWIAKSLPQLPLTWTSESFTMAGKSYSSADHLPVMIAPNPLPGGEARYIVLNTGHTFHESELAKFNYLLFPRWGDWAVLKTRVAPTPTEALVDEVVEAGYFDENWQFAQ